MPSTRTPLTVALVPRARPLPTVTKDSLERLPVPMTPHDTCLTLTLQVSLDHS